MPDPAFTESATAKIPSGSHELTPGGRVLCRDSENASSAAFAESESAGLIALGGRALEAGADASCIYWKTFADHFIRGICQIPEGGEIPPELPVPDINTLSEWMLNAPPMRGAEYLSPEVLRAIWDRLAGWTRERILQEKSIAAFLQRYAPAWARVGRVTLHLAENKNDAACPFAFMASYASGLSQSGRVSQLPLGKALAEYSGAKNKAGLLKLLTPLHAAAKSSQLVASLIESGDIFHPIAWTPPEAYDFLRQIPIFEEAGLLVRLPNWWKKKNSRPKVAATIGGKKGSAVGIDAMLDFKINVVVGDRKLTAQEIRELLEGDDGLVLFRGQWIEVDREKLQQALDHWEALASGEEISFIQGMRLLAGAPADLKSAEDLEEHRE